MNLNNIIDELSGNKDVFDKLLSGLKREVFLWKVKPEKWCLLEIVCHLYDEEREDFRTRIKYVIENSAEPFPVVDPPGWVVQRNYISRDYNEMLLKFVSERQQSVKWLQSLDEPNLSRSYLHPVFGKMTAKTFLANWLAHDYLHIRQIIKLKYDYLHHTSGEILDYAGKW